MKLLISILFLFLVTVENVTAQTHADKQNTQIPKTKKKNGFLKAVGNAALGIATTYVQSRVSNTPPSNNSSNNTTPPQTNSWSTPVQMSSPIENGFGTPVQMSTPIQNAFGTPVQISTPIQNAFGTPVQMSTPIQNAFGTPVQISTPIQNAFGTPVQLSTPIQNAFGTPVQLSTPIENAFGTPVQLSTPIENAFGTPIQLSTPIENGFGTPVQLSTPIANGFGTPVQLSTPIENAFGTPVQMSTPIANGFGTPVQMSTPIANGFGTPVQLSTSIQNGFGTPVQMGTPVQLGTPVQIASPTQANNIPVKGVMVKANKAELLKDTFKTIAPITPVATQPMNKGLLPFFYNGKTYYLDVIIEGAYAKLWARTNPNMCMASDFIAVRLRSSRQTEAQLKSNLCKVKRASDKVQLWGGCGGAAVAVACSLTVTEGSALVPVCEFAWANAPMAFKMCISAMSGKIIEKLGGTPFEAEMAQMTSGGYANFSSILSIGRENSCK